jgi:hypothetical protein
MWRTIVGPAGMTPSQLVGEILAANNVALQVYGKSLQNIILNTHGFSGGLYIAGMYENDGVTRPTMYAKDLAVFAILKPFNVASKGIGAAIAKSLAAEGASVVVNYASSKAGADTVVAAISAAGGKAVAVGGDVSKAAEANSAGPFLEGNCSKTAE